MTDVRLLELKTALKLKSFMLDYIRVMDIDDLTPFQRTVVDTHNKIEEDINRFFSQQEIEEGRSAISQELIQKK